MALNSFKDVQDMLNTFVTSQGVPVSGAPHADFWNSMTYAQFTTGNVPGVTDPNDPTKALPILKKGDSKNSNLVLALSGAVGTLFDPSHDGGDATGIGPMPPFPPPALPPAQIKDLADWIDRGCPEFASAPKSSHP
jgi:hypothetical protein